MYKNIKESLDVDVNKLKIIKDPTSRSNKDEETISHHHHDSSHHHHDEEDVNVNVPLLDPRKFERYDATSKVSILSLIDNKYL